MTARAVVVGAGAIGASVGAWLHASGVPTVLVARGEHGRVLARDGVDLRRPNGARRVKVPCVSTLAEAAPTVGDLVIVATMGQHTADAVDGLDPAVPVASFQNGLGPLEVLAARGHPTLAAVVYLPAERRAPGVIALPGMPVPGAVFVGPWSWPDRARALALSEVVVRALASSGIRAEVEPDPAPWVRAKLLTNLGGIVAALCDDPPADVITAAQDEARAVWRAQGAPFAEIGALTARVGDLHTAPVDGRARVGGSTRSALARGEPLETEILHAAIAAGGAALGIPTPVNAGLVALASVAHTERFRPGSLDGDGLRAWLGSQTSDEQGWRPAGPR